MGQPYEKKVGYFTPKGRFLFTDNAIIPNEEDKVSIAIELDKADGEELIARWKATYEALGLKLGAKGVQAPTLKHSNKVVMDPDNPSEYLRDAGGSVVTEPDPDKYLFNFYNSGYIITKDRKGNILSKKPRTILVKDAKKNKITETIAIGNGTIGRIGFTAGKWEYQGKSGVRLYYGGLQILQLQGGVDVDYDFPEEDTGYTYDSPDQEREPAVAAGEVPHELDDEIPF